MTSLLCIYKNLIILYACAFYSVVTVLLAKFFFILYNYRPNLQGVPGPLADTAELDLSLDHVKAWHYTLQLYKVFCLVITIRVHVYRWDGPGGFNAKVFFFQVSRHTKPKKKLSRNQQVLA